MLLRVQDLSWNFESHKFDHTWEKPLSQLLGYGKACGADFVECFLENRSTVSFRAENKKLTSLEPSIRYGAGIRVFKNKHDAYVTTNDLSLNGLLKALKKAIQILNLHEVQGSRLLQEVLFEPFRDYGEIHKKNDFKIPELQTVADLLLETNHKEHSVVPYLQSSSVGSFVDLQEVIVASSDGTFARDIRFNQRFGVSGLCVDGQDRVEVGKSEGSTSDPDFFKNISVDKMLEEIKNSAQTMIKADFIKAGQYPVVLADAFGGVIFHEACGHLLETTAVQRKATPFLDSKHEMIAHPCVSAYDEGTSKGAFGTISMDDEGMPAQNTLLIENGVLRNFLSDRTGEWLTGNPRTGSGRRQDYNFASASRMRNTYIAPSKEHSKEDLISSVDDGIYCKYLGGGSVNSTGEFNFGVTEAYRIKGGKIAEPLKGAILLGDAATILKRISMVGNDLTLSSGFCGSVSGTIYVTVGQPHIKVDLMTVGGR